MHLFHKWNTIAESPKWKAKQCEKCGKIEWIEKFQGGYQPRPSLPGELTLNPTPPRSRSSISTPMLITKDTHGVFSNDDNWIE